MIFLNLFFLPWSKRQCSVPHQDNALSHKLTCYKPVTQLKAWMDQWAQTKGSKESGGPPPKPGPLFEMTVINISPVKTK